MLSFLPKSIPFYIILSLSIALSVLSVISIKNYRARLEAELALVQAIDANTAMQKSLNLKDLSCKVDDTSVVELVAENQEVRDKIDTLADKIQKLKTGVSITPPETEARKNANDNTIYGPELLSPDLQRLLDQSYCVADPTASICGSTGQSPDLPLQSKAIR